MPAENEDFVLPRRLLRRQREAAEEEEDNDDDVVEAEDEKEAGRHSRASALAMASEAPMVLASRSPPRRGRVCSFFVCLFLVLVFIISLGEGRRNFVHSLEDVEEMMRTALT